MVKSVQLTTISKFVVQDGIRLKVIKGHDLLGCNVKSGDGLCFVPQYTADQLIDTGCIEAAFRTTDVRELKSKCKFACKTPTHRNVIITQIDNHQYALTGSKIGFEIQNADNTISRNYSYSMTHGSLLVTIPCMHTLSLLNQGEIIFVGPPCRLGVSDNLEMVISLPAVFTQLDSFKIRPDSQILSYGNISEVLDRNWKFQNIPELNISVTRNFTLQEWQDVIYAVHGAVSSISFIWLLALTILFVMLKRDKQMGSPVIVNALPAIEPPALPARKPRTT